MTNKLEATPCVWIKFKGDKSLVSELLKWLLENEIYSLGFGGLVGNGNYSHAHTAEDAERIAEWFKSKGVEAG